MLYVFLELPVKVNYCTSIINTHTVLLIRIARIAHPKNEIAYILDQK